jgi:copper transport protein
MLRVLTLEAKSIAGPANVRTENDTLRLALPPNLPNGVYVVTYRVISLDSHPVSGTILFAIGNVSVPAGTNVGDTHHGYSPALAAVRALFVATLLLATGGVLALWRITAFDAAAVRRGRRHVLLATIAAFVIGGISLGVSGAFVAGAPLTAITGGEVWRIALASSLARSLAVAGTGLFLILIALARLDHAAGNLVAVTGSLIALASFALTGHAATASPTGLMGPVVALHALCAAFWLGALPVLLSALRAEPPGRAAVFVDRFSRHGVAAVVVILALGIVIAMVQVDHLALMWGTIYGLVLSAKIATVALLLAVAAFNKWHATPLLGTEPFVGIFRLRRAIFVEYFLFAVVLALTASLGQIEPPRAAVARDTQALAGKAEFMQTVTEAGALITFSVTPARIGHNAIAVDVADASGNRLRPMEVSLALALPSAGIEPIRRQMVRDATGRFVYHGTDMGVAGRWRVDAEVLIDDFTKKTATFDVEIR